MYVVNCSFLMICKGNKLALLWGEAQLCLPYVCLSKEKKKKSLVYCKNYNAFFFVKRRCGCTINNKGIISLSVAVCCVPSFHIYTFVVTIWEEF